MFRYKRFYAFPLFFILAGMVFSSQIFNQQNIDFDEIIDESNILNPDFLDLILCNNVGRNLVPIAFGDFVDKDSSFEFVTTIGDENDNQANFIQKTSDGGYIIVGSSIVSSDNTNDVYLIKTDSSGNKLWEKTFGGSSIEVGYSVQETSDGGYILVGLTSSFGAGSGDFYLVKTDSSGNKLWNNTFGGEALDVGHSVHQTSDGGYFIAGISSSSGEGRNEGYIVKTDASGTLLWNKTFGGIDGYWILSSDTTDDGGYILAGGLYRGPDIRDDVLLIKIDSDGEKIWEKTFGGSVDEHANFVQQTSDGGYIIVGQAATHGLSGEDVYLIKTDSSGDLIWQRLYGEEFQDIGNSVLETDDGGYIVVGLTASYGHGGLDGYIIKTDSSGNKVWDRAIGDIFDEWIDSVRITQDGGYILAGMTNSEGAGGMDVLLAKIEAVSNTNATKITLTTTTDVDDVEDSDTQLLLFLAAIVGISVTMVIIVLKFGLIRGGETNKSEQKAQQESNSKDNNYSKIN
jgi:hypothetical protein